MISFTIPGDPVPQGSKKAFVTGGRAVIVDDNRKRLKLWRSDVVDRARSEIGDRPVPLFGQHVPVAVRLVFGIARPPSVSPSKRPLPSVTPDVDKLARAALDALTTAGVWKDDAQVVQLLASKVYADDVGFLDVEVRPV